MTYVKTIYIYIYNLKQIYKPKKYPTTKITNSKAKKEKKKKKSKKKEAKNANSLESCPTENR